ncbi:MAG TPA: proton-conducting transporter membrane subunit [Clostridia bacterium]|nr:proton-conducting transporter membrane subunit [Clostridia bacterium]
MASVCAWLLGGATLPLMLIGLPILGGLIIWLLKKYYAAQVAAVLVFGLSNVFLCLALYLGGGASVSLPFAGYGFEAKFISGGLSAVLPLFASVVAFLLARYSVTYYRGKKEGGLFLLFFFVSVGFVNGALLSDNLPVMLVFWEGLLISMSALLLIGNLQKPRATIKMLWISGVADLMLMLGVIITIQVAGQSNISAISHLPVSGLGAAGCVLMLLGALGKAGAVPFHSWIPLAAEDAQSPFLALFPAALEKILGIGLAIRIVTQIYDVQPGSPVSTFVMIVGAVTLFIGVAMALIQKDMKRLLSYHAISQVGYMILGVGSALPIGIIGALFHMMNHVLYKSGLFLTAGAIEKRTGTTDLKIVSGLGKLMPVTAACFVVFGLAISGFPGLNGFFSKELIFDAALETNVVYYIVALVGAAMTAISFLKLGGAAFFGKLTLPQGVKHVKEAPVGMALPAIVLALLCVLLGVFNQLAHTFLLQPALGFTESYGGWPESGMLVTLSCVALGVALLDHLYGRKKSGSALQSADHIHYAPGAKQVYALAEAGKLDPYNWLTAVINGFSRVCMQIEKGVSWVYDKGVPGLVRGISSQLHRAANGSLTRYLALAAAGLVCVAIVFLIILL